MMLSMVVVLRLTSPVTSAAVAAEAARPHRGPRPRPAGLVTQHINSARLHDNFDIVANVHILGENTYHSPSHHLSPWLKVLFKSMYVDTPPDIGMLVSKPLPMGNLVTKDPSNCPWASHPNSRGDTKFKHRCLY